jgi:hypothetical protein
LQSSNKEYKQILFQEGVAASQASDSIQADLTGNVDLLTKYKQIKTRSDVAFIVLRIASHLPKGALLNQIHIDSSDPIHVIVDMQGDVYQENAEARIAVINGVSASIKNDLKLNRFFKHVDLVSLNQETIEGRQVTGFTIRCS